MLRTAFLAAFAGLSLLVAAPSPGRADDTSSCHAPAWAPEQPADFAISACAVRPWDRNRFDLPDGEKWVEGRWESTDYQLKDGDAQVSPVDVKARELALAEKAGGKLISDPKDSDAVLVKSSPDGDVWYIYEQTGGNSEQLASFSLTTIHVMALRQDVQAKAMTGTLDVHGTACVDPPWLVTGFPGYKRQSCDAKPFDQVRISLPDGDKTLEGRRSTVVYQAESDAAVAVPDAVKRNYVRALTAIGAKLMTPSDDIYHAYLMQQTPAGTVWYLFESQGGNEKSMGAYALTTVQIGELEQVVKAQAITTPLDVNGGQCKDPPWLVAQFPFFKRSGCENKTWDQVQIDLPDGPKTLEGRRTTVYYQLTDPTRDPAALLVQRNYVTALKAIGASLASRPDDIYHAYLTQQTTAGTFWFLYDHGGGNEESTTGYSLTTVQIAPFDQQVVTRKLTGVLDTNGKTCGDPPWLEKQFSYYKPAHCHDRDVDVVAVDLPSGRKILAGRVLQTDYLLTDASRDPAALYVGRNYRTGLENIGARLVSKPEDTDVEVFRQTLPFGDFWYIYRHTGGSQQSVVSYSLTTVQVGGPPPKSCKLEVYGVNFAFDKATLKPDSEPVLNEVLALFNADPGYAAEIGGHTDNVGTRPYNMKLSAERAAAVKAWLVAHEIAGTRITTHGYADTQPLVPNTTEENRAKNRRVELKRKNCQG